MLSNKIASNFLFAALFVTSSYSFSGQVTPDDLVKMLNDPAGWRALGTVNPGVEDGAHHDLYANSAVLASVLRSQGVEVPYHKLTNYPAGGMAAFVEYLGRIPGNKISANEETCGIAVSHLYSFAFSLKLQEKGPKWARPELSDAEAPAKALEAGKKFKELRDLAAEMCDSWKYRKVTKAFDDLLARVSDEMPYLLNTALPQAQARENTEIAERQAAQLEAEKLAQSKLLGPPMLKALSGITPAITSDPFARCLELGKIFPASPSSECMHDVQRKAENSYHQALTNKLKNISKARATAIQDEENNLAFVANSKCNKDSFDVEGLTRCNYVYYKTKEFQLTQNPIKSDAQVSSDYLARAKTLAQKYPSTASIPGQEMRNYTTLLNDASNLGNLEAKVQLADFYSNDMSDFNNLYAAEKLLEDVENSQGQTEQTQKLLSKITPALDARREASKPSNIRAAWRGQAKGSTDYAVKAALSLDEMSRSGMACDALVNGGYAMANSHGVDINFRLKFVVENTTDNLYKVGCLY